MTIGATARKNPKSWRLNDEQKKMVEDNIGLAFKYSNWRNPPAGIDNHYWLSICFEGLCYTARKWKDGAGRSFASYFYLVMKSKWNQCNKHFRKVKSRSFELGIKFESQMSDSDLFEYSGFGGKTPSSGQFDRELFDKNFPSVLSSLTELQKNIIRSRLKGNSFKDISTELGLKLKNVKSVYCTALRNLRINSRGIDLGIGVR